MLARFPTDFDFGPGFTFAGRGRAGRRGSVGKRHGKLLRDPFLEAGAPFVSVAPHEEALARLSIRSDRPAAGRRAGGGRAREDVGLVRGPWRRRAAPGGGPCSCRVRP